ncbi:nicotinate-nucleotide--dimethylbenzimidazole phosphoribosyltransferase [Silvimonas amylolytica]|uniref:Nicotinate-nucleotide--dimethylbenzimidazole phosphoribosyltransferase n=1 Tax=Silvimonas amylolytica TaxID=449663 RepID=A0ABQ2PMS2_9NEIS|nr:nicotinate-nucleotide--dimethylbenzimidazole phosphoribosyltransferase [Silvimonas amylolytica]GGP26583.1 nicotinate-nucleotide--dimethylbenzimidazole phosphoribosyltransferase [Silvimonas amylolytica]
MKQLLPSFDIPALDGGLVARLQHRFDRKTKPLGSLGQLEALAVQLGVIQQRPDPQITRPAMLVFAADHGLARAGVSPYPAEVTPQMVLNFLAGGAAISVLCRSHQMDLKVVNAGVNADFAPHPLLIDRPVAKGTANSLEAPAMTPEQVHQAIETGAQIVYALADEGVTLIGLGEMGIGNTSAAALLMARLTGEPVSACAGRGTGLDDAGLARKIAVLEQVLARHADALEPLEALAALGGLEIAMLVGAILAAASRRIAILVDGFIVTSAVLVASKLAPGVLGYCIFSHCSGEQGHRLLLLHLGARRPLLDLGLRLGEGSGAALALPLVRSAVDLLNQMASFDEAGVSERSE